MNAEAIFNYPKLYDMKLKAVIKLNGTDRISLNEYIKGKNILDIGCGLKQYFYDVTKAKSRTAIDSSPKMVNMARRLYLDTNYQVASADNLPFKDKKFDVALLIGVLHHIESSKWNKILSESLRVSKDYVIILDHVKNSNPLKSLLQTIWWKVVDSGKQYNTENEWNKVLKPYNIVRQFTTGFWESIHIYKIRRSTEI